MGHTDAVEVNLRFLALKRLKYADAMDVADALGISLKTVIDAMIGNSEAADEVADAVARFEEELLEAERATGGYTAAQTEAQGGVEKFSKTHNRIADHVDKSQEALDRERQAGSKSKDAPYEPAGTVDGT